MQIQEVLQNFHIVRLESLPKIGMCIPEVEKHFPKVGKHFLMGNASLPSSPNKGFLAAKL